MGNGVGCRLNTSRPKCNMVSHNIILFYIDTELLIHTPISRRDTEQTDTGIDYIHILSRFLGHVEKNKYLCIVVH